MSQLVVNEDLKQRGLSAQRKTLAGIFEFAECMVELDNECVTKQGGSTYSQVAQEWWGIGSQAAASDWLRIGLDENLPAMQMSLPASKETLLYIARLTLEQKQYGLDQGIINPDMRRQDVKRCKQEEPTVYKPTYSDHYLRVIAHIERVGGRVKADLLSYLLQTEEKDPDTDWRELIPQDPKDDPELCLAISKTIQRFTHPDMGGTVATSQRANIAHSKLKKAIQ